MKAKKKANFKNEARNANGTIEKRCTDCGEWKLLTEFYPDNLKLFCVKSNCKVCHSSYMKEYKINNKEKSAEWWTKTAYNLSTEDLGKMIALQDNKCAICKKEMTGYKEPQIDHNHKSGKVRGLLCLKCNIGIGYFNDETKLLVAAINYLIRN